MRRSLQILVCLIWLIVASAISFAPALGVAAELPKSVLEAARKEGKVVWYTSLQNDYGNPIMKAFQKKYKIPVQRYRSGAQKMLQKFYAERKRGLIAPDVISALNPPAFWEMKRLGWLKPEMSTLPSWNELRPLGQGPEGHWAVNRMTFYGIFWNKKKLGSVPGPKTWMDLVHPRYKEKLALPDPTRVGGMNALSIVLSGMYGEGYFQKLNANKPLIFPQAGLIRNSVIRGQRAIGVAGMNNYLLAKKKGIDVGFSHPKDYSFAVQGPIALVKGGPNPNAGKVFSNYLLSKESQQLLTQFYFSMRKDLAPPPGSPDFNKIVLFDFSKYGPKKLKELSGRLGDILRGK